MNQRPYLATFPRTRERNASHCPSLLYEVPAPTTNHSPGLRIEHGLPIAAGRTISLRGYNGVGSMWPMAADRAVSLGAVDLPVRSSRRFHSG